ncbi:ribosome silencing factor [Rhodococcus sp. D2-41]|uniref:ribosome silencing factor n=1 Tax=Speluncibacter jeojiensis TaxID=2710754 RepID=UPI0024108FC8|nr:ribosome silencing factor [Rhodococcus sp. D2-41]MDG3008537.1 ribosome silencing factor [Rhodococcus sp. D2-41]
MSASDEARQMARVAALAATDKQAVDVVVLDVSEHLVITDCFLIASAPSERQVGAIVDNIEEKLREIGLRPARREGVREGRWALLDYIDMVVHVQHEEEREFYALERLWKDCPSLVLEGVDTVPPRHGSVPDIDGSGEGSADGAVQTDTDAVVDAPVTESPR